ncbi:NAD/NADP octopine/nopaline dehydrogenase family protein [uncultured Adlercreutzia sp.]|uniref:NAD/NADP octopine/nopaline dehydrogenase family protein n=1 Tax=uncultured Adlercreutzia sp. TaxID=875803 RepID=UPI00266B7A6C|nr:NAD/NADP octopine/nopaline dehydrogenase family protein [uncultured Adlercreutzia sp.]
MNITIVGGGNIGTLMAGDFAAAGHSVTMLVSDPARWSNTLQVLGEGDVLLKEGPLACVTDSAAQAMRSSEIVFVTHPTFMLGETAQRLLPFATEGQLIGIVPGACGEFFFGGALDRGAALFGLQRVHDIARIKERGASVYSLGRKPEIQVGALPSARSQEIAALMADLFAMPAVALPNYLIETLTPSNPILHTTRIRSMFRDWKDGKTYPRNILFYEEWDVPSAELLIACDDELQNLCRAVEGATGLDLSLVRPLKEHYESANAPALAAKISSIPAFKGLTSPMKEVEAGQWIPDFQSRYFRADFAYGLKAIRDIAALAGLPTPFMDDVYQWYISNTGQADIALSGMPSTLGELARLYR